MPAKRSPHPLTVARALRGLSQADLSERSGVSRETISAIENSRVAPHLETLEALAAGLGIADRDALRPGTPNIAALSCQA